MAINLNSLNANTDAVGQDVNQIQAQNEYLDTKQVAAQAAELFKQGNLSGAYGLLIQAAPSLAPKILPEVAKYNPMLANQLAQGKTAGTLQAQTGFGSNPNQLAHVKGDYSVEAAEARGSAQQNKPVIRSDKDSPTGFSKIEPSTGQKQFVTQAGTPYQGPAEKSPAIAEGPTTDPIKPEAPKLQGNEAIDSSGNKILISPRQRDIINSTRKEFDSETKELVKSIDSAESALDYINKNIPGSQTVEKLRILKSVVSGRINQQEFQAFGQGAGLVNRIENAISEASGKGMSSGTQDLMRRLTQTALDVTTKEYDSHLQNAVQRNPEVDPMILKTHLVGNGPTHYQQILNKVKAMDPQDQAAFNYAHDHGNDPAAQPILQHLGKKYGF